MTLSELLLQTVNENGGFLLSLDVARMAKLDRLRQLLVRMNGCRFVAAAQDVQHIVDLIESTGKDYVRDVSLPGNDPAYLGILRAITPSREKLLATVES